jgi:hypothetical protein
MEILDPIDLDRFDDDDGEAFRYVTDRMQEVLTALSADRMLPPLL